LVILPQLTRDRRSIATGLGALELPTGRTSIFGSAQNLLDRIAVSGFAGLDGKNALIDVIAVFDGVRTPANGYAR
jgi:hypothetical protein